LPVFTVGYLINLLLIGNGMDALYLTVIVHGDLNASHLPLLKEIRRKVLEVIPQKYPAVGADYQPTYYHFHVHVAHLRHDTIPGGSVVGRLICWTILLATLKLSIQIIIKKLL